MSKTKIQTNFKFIKAYKKVIRLLQGKSIRLLWPRNCFIGIVWSWKGLRGGGMGMGEMEKQGLQIVILMIYDITRLISILLNIYK